MLGQINQIAVIGAGTMGIGICEVAAAHGHLVKLFDVDESAAKNALVMMSDRLDKRVLRGKIAAQEKIDLIEKIEVVNELEALADADLVIEAIVENLDIKRQLFHKLERICSSNTLLTSNTSSLSITAIAAHLKTPERLFGLHFFNPAPVMKLVEVVSGLLTDPKYIKMGQNLCQSWGKVPVVASSTPGFIVNRVARSFYGEPLKMMQEQLASPHFFDAVMTKVAGFKMGPFTLMDLIGIDVNYSVSQSVYQAMYNDPRFKPSLIQAEMVHAGTLGKKSGRGFYRYDLELPVAESLYEHACQAPEQISLPTNLGVLEPLFKGIEDSAVEVRLGDDIQIGNCLVLLTEGAKADDLQSYFSESGLSVALIDWSFDYELAEAVNLTFSSDVTVVDKQAVIGLFQLLGKSVLLSDDQPGMVVMRTLVMLINEAADAVFNGVCSASDVDLAMCHGVNYPKGLLAFADALGWEWVNDGLANLQGWFGDDRYRRSPYIQNKIQVKS